jgi:hypothetical protein
MSGNARVEFVPTNGSPRPMHSNSPEQITIVSTPPAQPFVEVGFLEGRSSEYARQSYKEVVASMRAAAATYGCDALLITGVNNDVSGWRGSSTHPGYHGACLVFPNQQEAPPPPSTQPPPAPAGMLFRNSEGTIYRVQPESYESARRLGWVPVGNP